MADEIVNKGIVFTKGQLLNSKRFSDYVDVLNALLDDGKTYTMDEVTMAIKNFMNKEVQ
jgi:glutamyl/glutaminyl-tRNA synthetase